MLVALFVTDEFGAIAVLAGATSFVVALTAEFVFKSLIGGCVLSVADSGLALSTDTFPCNAGIVINNAEIIKTAAATIVIFDKIVAVPRGLKAELEILLVKSAPASVFPGCNSTETISAMQETKNIV